MTSASTTVIDATRGLRSNEHLELLDAIDKLRRENISADISVPQIVVCGDQSSGKSSVLEAIARVRFPRGSRLTTRFPIEVVLRNAATQSVAVRLHPSPERHDHAQLTRIASFDPTGDASDPDQFEKIVEQAKDHLESLEKGGSFWNDRLIAEISGPKQPHLTLVDLPGLIHNSKADDPETIKKITKTYLDDPRTIVLAVVHAMNDQANQQVLSLVEQTGSARTRAMGIITKPDLVPKNSDDELAVIEMARNNEVHLGLGWHVLRNVGHHEEQSVRDRRDELESAFFSTGAWSNIDAENVGISNLRKKLSKNLLLGIRRDLPKLVEEMQTELTRCTGSLDLLGESRESAGQQRAYFAKIVSQLQRLVEAGLDGRYSEADSKFFNGAEGKQLRDTINGELREFAATLRDNGKTFHIYSHVGVKPSKLPEFPFTEKPCFTQPPSAQAIRLPQAIDLQRYCKALAEHMRGKQGKHLQIHAAPIVPDIFRQQSVAWERITRRCVDRCYTRALEFMERAVMHVAGKHTGDKLLQLHVIPAFESKMDVLTDKVSDLMWPYLRSHPITYSRKLSQKTSGLLGSGYEAELREITKESVADPSLFFAAEAVDQAETYYEIAQDALVDNVATLAIERWLLSDLPSLISSETVWTLSNDDIEKIAAEPPEFREQRRRLTQQVSALQDAMRICSRHARPRVTDDQLSGATSAKVHVEAPPRSPTPSVLQNSAEWRSNAGAGLFGGSFNFNDPTRATDTLQAPKAGTATGTPNGVNGFGGSLFGNLTPSRSPSPAFGGFGSGERPSLKTGSLFGQAQDRSGGRTL